jgi:hypothetical protein
MQNCYRHALLVVAVAVVIAVFGFVDVVFVDVIDQLCTPVRILWFISATKLAR